MLTRDRMPLANPQSGGVVGGCRALNYPVPTVTTVQTLYLPLLLLLLPMLPPPLSIRYFPSVYPPSISIMRVMHVSGGAYRVL